MPPWTWLSCGPVGGDFVASARSGNHRGRMVPLSPCDPYAPYAAALVAAVTCRSRNR